MEGRKRVGLVLCLRSSPQTKGESFILCAFLSLYLSEIYRSIRGVSEATLKTPLSRVVVAFSVNGILSFLFFPRAKVRETSSANFPLSRSPLLPVTAQSWRETLIVATPLEYQKAFIRWVAGSKEGGARNGKRLGMECT